MAAKEFNRHHYSYSYLVRAVELVPTLAKEEGREDMKGVSRKEEDLCIQCHRE